MKEIPQLLEFPCHGLFSFVGVGKSIFFIRIVFENFLTHWAVVKRILRYLKGILFHGLLLQPAPISKPMALYAFCDADWASDIEDRRSTSGAAIFLGSNLISWWSQKQKVTARSSTEAEYHSLAQTSTELTWI